MTDYEAEHNLPTHSASKISNSIRRRPSLTTFYSSLRSLDTSETNGAHSVPLPVNVEASFVLLAEALTSQLTSPGPEQDTDALSSMLEFLRTSAADPPETVKGVPDSFLDSLERVPKGKLGEDSCPICGDKFKEDPYPLVVVLPCHANHKFDFGCIRPWLKLNSTCPLDRKDVLPKKEVVVTKKAEAEVDEDEDYDDYYA